MSRITKEEVFHAANTLNDKGVKPTTNKVREILGKGSFSTIGQWLQEWEPDVQLIDEVPGIPSSLDAAFSLLWSACYKEVESLLAFRVVELQTLIDEQAGELLSSAAIIDGLENEIESKDSIINLHQLKHDDLTFRLHEMERAFTDLDNRFHSLESQFETMRNDRDAWIDRSTKWQSDAQEKAGMLKAFQEGFSPSSLDLSKPSVSNSKSSISKPKSSKNKKPSLSDDPVLPVLDN